MLKQHVIATIVPDSRNRATGALFQPVYRLAALARRFFRTVESDLCFLSKAFLSRRSKHVGSHRQDDDAVFSHVEGHTNEGFTYEDYIMEDTIR
jgi:hypothetical protein